MAPAQDSNTAFFARLLNPLNNWYSFLVFGVLGTIPSIIMTYNGLDVMRDRFQAQFYDTEDTFDFVIGKKEHDFFFFKKWLLLYKTD
jgi:hypothetical protein